MNDIAHLEHRASSSQSRHEGESSFGLCDRLDRTRDNSQRQLPTDHDYAVPTREYQTDQSSPFLPWLLLALSSGKQRQQQKQHHRWRRLTRSLHIRPTHSSSESLSRPWNISPLKRYSIRLSGMTKRWAVRTIVHTPSRANVIICGNQFKDVTDVHNLAIGRIQMDVHTRSRLIWRNFHGKYPHFAWFLSAHCDLFRNASVRPKGLIEHRPEQPSKECLLGRVDLIDRFNQPPAQKDQSTVLLSRGVWVQSPPRPPLDSKGAAF